MLGYEIEAMKEVNVNFVVYFTVVYLAVVNLTYLTVFYCLAYTADDDS